MPLFAPGFGADTEQGRLAAEMLRITFPYALFISLASMAGGILNSYGRFAVPALSPVLMNLSMIAAALCLAPLLQSWGYDPVLALAWGVFRSEEHTSELQSLMRISYAVFCLKKKII